MIQAIKRLWQGFVPPEKPSVSLGWLLRTAHEAGVNVEAESCIIGIRGFYNRDSNQRGIYDDAIFLVRPSGVLSFNCNVDPSVHRKGVANLIPGVWLYKRGIHGLSKPKHEQYEALVQAGPVKVKRDGEGLDSGWFGINIHRGGRSGTSSLGCQTIHPDQWNEFFGAVKNTMTIRRQNTIKYILKEMTDEIY